MNFTAFDHACMAQALQLARKGLFTTHPNPRVGCVIARDGSVIGNGWHRAAGQPHAEVEAIRDAGGAVRGATVYVTLEPCSHQGRTPPCADALVEAGVAEVVVAAGDPDPRVNGGGVKRLEEAGIQCRSGLMKDAAEALNVGFVSRLRRGRPWVRVKLAQSLDGRTALASGESRWITGSAARRDVQTWRARASAILSGVGTVLADDPSLNVRLDGVTRQPLRVIVDSRWRTPPDARTLAVAGEVLIAGLESVAAPEALQESAAELLPLPQCDGRVDLHGLMRELAGREINEVHVEAGGVLGGALVKERLADEILLYQAPCLLGEDARASLAVAGPADMDRRLEFTCLEQRRIGGDLRMRLLPQYPGN